MRYVTVAGTSVSVIGLGTWQFGSREWRYGNDYANREAIALTRRALDLGINLIDTAEIYGLGRSERIVGAAIADRRDQVFLATKLFPALPLSPVVRQRGRASARRLGVRWIDLYQLHAPNPVIPLSRAMRGFADLAADGLIRDVGVSNCSLEQWQEAEAALGGTVLSNQVRYSLATRAPERAILPWAQANDHLVIAYSPLAQGLLSGAYGPAQPTTRRATAKPVVPARQPAAGRAFGGMRPRGGDQARSHAGAGGTRVAGTASQRGRDPGCAHGRPAGGERCRRRAAPGRRRRPPADRSERSVPADATQVGGTTTDWHLANRGCRSAPPSA